MIDDCVYKVNSLIMYNNKRDLICNLVAPPSVLLLFITDMPQLRLLGSVVTGNRIRTTDIVSAVSS